MARAHGRAIDASTMRTNLRTHFPKIAAQKGDQGRFASNLDRQSANKR
tara:strand:- start:251 stop:394 length:144 start_codon:yes stop_codon:yes gene_type:complete